MVFTQNPIATFVKQPQNGKATSNNTTNTVIYTAGTNGSKLNMFNATTNAATAVAVSIQILNGSTLYTIGATSLPADAGTNSTVAAVNLLNTNVIPSLPTDSDGNPYLVLISGDQLQITLGATIASPNLATFFVQGGDF